MTTVLANSPAAAQSQDPSFRFLKDIAKDLTAGDVTFPTFSMATLKIRQALEDPDISLERLAAVVASEPLLAAKLVRLANSAALNPTGRAPAKDVRTAVLRTGHTTIRTVAMAVAYDQLRAERDLQQHRVRSEAAWRHTARVACLCYLLATKVTLTNPHEAMFAGLVHDIGYFYLLSRTPAYPELAGHPDVLDEILREWHPSIGQAVMHSFGLSDAVMEAIGEHETAMVESQPTSLAGLVRLANALADATNPAGVSSIADFIAPEITALVESSSDDLAALASAFS